MPFSGYAGVFFAISRPYVPRQTAGTCPDSATCCPDEAGSFLCCRTTNIPVSAGGTCCGGDCCSDGESCCSDDTGSTCCVVQNTYCVTKDAAAPSYPSRCCPRWTVGCTAGSVGCCDPAQPWQRSIGVSEGLGAPSTAAKRRSPGQWRADGTAFALVVSGAEPASKSLLSLSIDMSTGDVTSRTLSRGFLSIIQMVARHVSSSGDPTRRVFYYFDANFTAGGGAPLKRAVPPTS